MRLPKILVLIIFAISHRQGAHCEASTDTNASAAGPSLVPSGTLAYPFVWRMGY